MPDPARPAARKRRGPVPDSSGSPTRGRARLAVVPPSGRGVFCNRTLNLRATAAVGYDMDYTLVHYHTREWETRAYRHLRRRLVDQGWPVAGLAFDPDLVVRGLIIDRELGNVLKADRFGYVRLAAHGTRLLEFEAQKRTYGRVVVDLAEPRWVFLNALFSLSEAVMYSQLVDLLDERSLPEVLGYADLYDRVRQALDAAHLEGQLKAEILADPARFVDLDAEAPLALLDQRQAGKRLLLVTNSDWPYTRVMMSYAFDRFLPRGTTWRDLFDLVIVAANKPEFFDSRTPIFRVVDDEGLLRPCPTGLDGDGVYFAGNAGLVEAYLGLDGGDILFVGDHVYGDVQRSKSGRRWRTALILRELEAELAARAAFGDHEEEIAALMVVKTRLEAQHCATRLELQRRRKRYGPRGRSSEGQLWARQTELRAELTALDEQIAPLAQAAGELHNRRWGLLMRTGMDKSYLARQIERHADIYTSRVSNFLYATPFIYFRSQRSSLPHDPGPLAADPTTSGRDDPGEAV